MDVSVSWYNFEERILCYIFEGKWTWEAFLLAYEQEKELQKNLNGMRYDTIADLTTNSYVPRGTGSVHIRRILKEKRVTSKGLTVIASPHLIISMGVQLAITLAPEISDVFKSVKSVEEAHQLILQLRSEKAKPV